MSTARARIAVSTLFLVHGMVVGNWLARIPAVQQKLNLSDAALGFSLLGAGAGALLAMPLAARWANSLDTKLLARVFALCFCAALPLPGIVPSGWLLGPALAVYGAAGGCMNVLMNSKGVELEKAWGRPLMSSFHALFSLGAMAGAAMGALAAGWRLTPALQFSVAGAALAGVAAVAGWYLEPGNTREGQEPFRIANLRGTLIALSLIAFCILLCEGAIADWSAVYIAELPGATAAIAALGYTVFSAAMAIGRMAGDSLNRRFGAVAVVRYGAALSAAGFFGALIAGNVAGALAGFGCAGLGYASIFPIVTSAAGRQKRVSPHSGIAAVTTVGYLGFLLGPPAIGLLSQAVGLRFALTAAVILTGAALMLADAVGPPRRTAQTSLARTAR